LNKNLKDKDLQLIYLITNKFRQKVESKLLKIKDIVFIRSQDELIANLKRYVSRYNLSSHQKADEYEVDAYKILSWFAFILLGQKQDKANIFTRESQVKIIMLAVDRLNTFLKVECKSNLDNNYLMKLVIISHNSLNDKMESISISKNGIYIAFKSAKSLCKSIKGEQ